MASVQYLLYLSGFLPSLVHLHHEKACSCCCRYCKKLCSSSPTGYNSPLVPGFLSRSPGYDVQSPLEDIDWHHWFWRTTPLSFHHLPWSSVFHCLVHDLHQTVKKPWSVHLELLCFPYQVAENKLKRNSRKRVILTILKKMCLTVGHVIIFTC